MNKQMQTKSKKHSTTSHIHSQSKKTNISNYKTRNFSQKNISSLQSSFGNNAVSRLVQSGQLQRKPQANSANKLEDNLKTQNITTNNLLDKNISKENVHAPEEGNKIRDVHRGAMAVVSIEALLREMYQKMDVAIGKEANYMLSKGVSEGDVAEWVVEARNAAKSKIRKWDLDVLRLLAEQRNTKVYGDKLGPSYKQLREGIPGVKEPKTNKQIIESAQKTNLKVDKWSGYLKIAGKIMITIEVGVSTYEVAISDPKDRPKTLIREVAGLAGAAAGGWLGAKAGGAIGAGIGSLLGGVGAIPLSAIGSILGGIGGAIGGGIFGQKASKVLVHEFYPPEDTLIEGSFE